MAHVNTAEIQEVLGGVDYPASKQELINHAEQNSDHNEEVMNVLNQLPDRNYNSPAEVNKEVKNIE